MKRITGLLILSFCLIISFSQAQNWNLVASGTAKDLFAISFPSSTVGYIAGEDSLILKSTDGGENWSPLDMSSFPFVANDFDIVDIEFMTDDIGYITVGPYSGTYKTVDGGVNWTAIDLIYACYNRGLYFFDENRGFLGGSGCFSGEIINKLENGVWDETNITPQFIQSNGIINNFDFWDDSLGLATSTADYFFRTTDGGTTWDTISNGLNPRDSLMSVLFVDSAQVLATFLHGQNAGFGLLISYDAGLTWQPEVNSATFYYPNMYASLQTGYRNVFVGGEVQNTSGGINPGMIYRTDEQLSFWMVDNVAESIRDFGSYSDSVVFAVGENGYVIVNQDLSALDIDETEVHNFEVYPNPSSGQVTIRTETKDIRYIEIFDTKGNLVERHFNPVLDNFIWEINGLDKGVYSIKLSTGTGLYSKKVVIF